MTALLLNADIVAGNAARQWLAGDSGKPRIFMLFEKKYKWICNHGRPQRGKTGVCPLEIWSKNSKHLENLKTAVQFRLISLILATAVHLPEWHTAQEGGSLFWYHEVVGLQFTHVRYFACRCRLQSLWADCSIVTLYCVTVTWQQIFKGSVTVVGVLPHVAVERRHLWQKMLRDSDC